MASISFCFHCCRFFFNFRSCYGLASAVKKSFSLCESNKWIIHMCVFTISIIKCILNSVRLLCVCFVWNVWELSKWWMQVECYCYGTFHSFFPLQFYHSICSKPRQNGMLLISFDLILMRFVQNEISLKHVLIESKCQKREQNNGHKWKYVENHVNLCDLKRFNRRIVFRIIFFLSFVSLEEKK